MTQVGQALCDQFEEISRSELVRLRRKIASLRPEDRAAVEAAAVELTQSIAKGLDARIASSDAPGLGDVVAQIFSIQRAPATDASV
jgi:hypothetical protein